MVGLPTIIATIITKIDLHSPKKTLANTYRGSCLAFEHRDFHFTPHSRTLLFNESRFPRPRWRHQRLGLPSRRGRNRRAFHTIAIQASPPRARSDPATERHGLEGCCRFEPARGCQGAP